MAVTLKRTRLRGVYGKPWSKMSKIPLTQDLLRKVGKIIIKNVIRECQVEIERSRTLSTMSLPNTEKFYKSFDFRIKGTSTVEIFSTWPWIGPILSGTDGPFPMKWLTQQNGVKVVPLKADDGTVIFRTAPLTAREAWIHPGVAKHNNFIRRGVEKGRKEAAKVLMKHVKHVLLQGDPTR